MSNINLISSELLNSAVISSLQEVAGGLASNLSKMQPSDPFVVSGTSAQVDIYLGGIKTFDVVSLLHSNLTGPCKNNWLQSTQKFSESSVWLTDIWGGDAQVEEDATTAPDQTVTADKMTSVAGISSIGQLVPIPIVQETTYTFSINVARVLGGTEATTATITLASGTDVGTIFKTLVITLPASGFIREKISFTASYSGNLYVGVGNINSGTSGIYLWGAQFNIGSDLVTYRENSLFATWRIRTANLESDLTSSPITDTGNILFSAGPTNASARHSFYKSPTLLDASWVRLDISDDDNPTGFLSIGRGIIGNAFEPIINLQYASSSGYNDTSLIDTTETSTIPTEQVNRPVSDIILNLESEEERSRVNEFLRTLGSSKDILISIDHSDVIYGHDKLVHGLLQKTRSISEASYNLFETRLTVVGLT